MLIDFHCHIHDDGTGAQTDIVAEEARRIGLDYVVMYECVTHSRESLETVQRCNEMCRFAYEREPDFFIPFVYTHPNLGQAGIDELNKGFDWGARGIKLEIASVITDKCVEPVIELAIERDVPLVQPGALKPDRSTEDLELDVVVGPDHPGADMAQALWQLDLEVVAAGGIRADLDGLGVEVEGTNVLLFFDQGKSDAIGHASILLEKSQPLVSPWAP